MGLADQVNEWLLREALGEPKLEDLFYNLCMKLLGIGVPISRARLNWPTLHPLFRAEMISWNRHDQKATLDHFNHQEANTDAWQKSVLWHMLEYDLSMLRRRLSGPGKLLDFPLLGELAAQGYTDYFVLKTLFEQPGMATDSRWSGIFVIWGCDRESGFTDEDLTILQEIQRSLALACKSIIQSQITTNIVETYLGRQAGRSVLDGNIKLGDGATAKALVWYSDMRGSTHLTGTLPSEEFLKLLNDYFECAARPAIRAGGEVLAFIGDAVLVIFPLESRAEGERVTAKILDAVAQSFRMRDTVNAARRERGEAEINFGIGLNVGTVVFGNIGVPERLSFTVIGSAVTEVERIEKLTKTLDANVLATAQVAGLVPGRWSSAGHHCLAGVEEPMELFVPLDCGEAVLKAAE
ncbi:adenylate/guanylate cyclase domain-containing protein [Jiella sp. MQZ9-1]|uniref:Adenylate/guanylate cyclase domain-containing protein n=1 Tax=Jiella flava TaxID=2816857 RepID=A0A939G193_9HYPH|nr:adenylate/guanylate cyclase domain-containing protein [Jiella flava]MBO0663703.1 adenylate/guanylate cyclase domain-containing protein [Jiella flava]MCD2472276.1 adenylate/guanylate cyclase domain-containing protein [Jiella flava]